MHTYGAACDSSCRWIRYAEMLTVNIEALMRLFQVPIMLAHFVPSPAASKQ